MPTAAEAPKEWDVVVEVTVRVKAADYGAIARVLENRDEGGTPRPLGSTGPVHERGWQDLFYQLPDEQEVLGHLAFNAVLNGVEDVSRLDGWGDLPAGSVTMELNRNSFSVAEVR